MCMMNPHYNNNNNNNNTSICKAHNVSIRAESEAPDDDEEEQMLYHQLPGREEGHPACKTLGVGLLVMTI